MPPLCPPPQFLAISPGLGLGNIVLVPDLPAVLIFLNQLVAPEEGLLPHRHAQGIVVAPMTDPLEAALPVAAVVIFPRTAPTPKLLPLSFVPGIPSVKQIYLFNFPNF